MRVFALPVALMVACLCVLVALMGIGLMPTTWYELSPTSQATTPGEGHRPRRHMLLRPRTQDGATSGGGGDVGRQGLAC